MPFTNIAENAEGGQLVFWRRDPDTQKPVRFRIRSVPAAFDKQLRAEFNRGVKVDRMAKRSAVELTEKTIEATRRRAGYALLDSDSFVIRIGDAAAAAAYGEVLGEQLQPGQDVKLDGRWSPALQELVLTYMPKLSAWLSDKADELLAQEAEEEEDLGKI